MRCNNFYAFREKTVKSNTNKIFIKNTTKISRIFWFSVESYADKCLILKILHIYQFFPDLEYFRGDCVICMNYGIVGSTRYSGLVRNVDVLAGILAGKLLDLEQLGFSPSNGYMYGFSYGARIAILAGILHGPQKLAEIDGELFFQLNYIPIYYCWLNFSLWYGWTSVRQTSNFEQQSRS